MMKAHFLFFGFLFFLSSPAFAEVADKEPTTLQLWLVSVVLTAVAIGFGVKRPWFALFLLPVSLLCAWSRVSELRDPFVGPAIRAELGDAYAVHGYLSAAMGIAGPIIAWAVLRFYRAGAKRSR